MKNIIEKSCTFTNLCNKPTLCCNYCKEKNCTDRCMDNKDICKYLIDFISKQDLDASRNKMFFNIPATKKKETVDKEISNPVKTIEPKHKEKVDKKVKTENKIEEKELLW